MVVYVVFPDTIAIPYHNIQELIYHNTSLHSVLTISEILSVFAFLSVVFF